MFYYIIKVCFDGLSVLLLLYLLALIFIVFFLYFVVFFFLYFLLMAFINININPAAVGFKENPLVRSKIHFA